MVGEMTGESESWAWPGEEGAYVIPIIANCYLLVFFRVDKAEGVDESVQGLRREKAKEGTLGNPMVSFYSQIIIYILMSEQNPSGLFR